MSKNNKKIDITLTKSKKIFLYTVGGIALFCLMLAVYLKPLNLTLLDVPDIVSSKFVELKNNFARLKKDFSETKLDGKENNSQNYTYTASCSSKSITITSAVQGSETNLHVNAQFVCPACGNKRNIVLKKGQNLVSCNRKKMWYGSEISACDYSTNVTLQVTRNSH